MNAIEVVVDPFAPPKVKDGVGRTCWTWKPLEVNLAVSSCSVKLHEVMRKMPCFLTSVLTAFE